VSLILEGGEPFFMPGNQIGCLLIHGLTGTPKEMRWLGEHLADQGYTVLCPRLFGNATHRNDLTRARWRDWWACVEDGYNLIRSACSHIVLIGLSLGGVLSFAMGSSLSVVGVVAMSTLYRIPDPRIARLRPIIPLISSVWRFLSIPGPSDWHDHEVEMLNLNYGVHSLRALAELHDLLIEMCNRLAHLDVPVLLIHAKGDGAAPPEHTTWIYERLGSLEKEILWIENSGHNLPRDAARKTVFAAVGDFVQRVTRANT